jgi:hypothetical protein
MVACVQDGTVFGSGAKLGNDNKLGKDSELKDNAVLGVRNYIAEGDHVGKVTLRFLCVQVSKRVCGSILPTAMRL